MADVSDSATPIRSGRFTFQRPVLLRPRLHLYPDRLELSGWRWFERYRRPIPFGRILKVDGADGAIVVWLVTGRALRLCVENPTTWATAIEARL